MVLFFLYRYDSSTIPESLKAVALTEAELQPFMCRSNDKSEVHWSEIPEQAAVQHVIYKSCTRKCIGELNAMHFKQTLNKIINLPQEL